MFQSRVETASQIFKCLGEHFPALEPHSRSVQKTHGSHFRSLCMGSGEPAQPTGLSKPPCPRKLGVHWKAQPLARAVLLHHSLLSGITDLEMSSLKLVKIEQRDPVKCLALNRHSLKVTSFPLCPGGRGWAHFIAPPDGRTEVGLWRGYGGGSLTSLSSLH